MAAKIFHPLLALIASASNNELAKYIEFLKEENKILRARIPSQVHTKPDERSRLIKFGKALGQAVEELLTIVAPQTFYRWCREEQSGKKKPNPKGGQRKPREIRELVVEIATTTSFGYTRIIGELRKLAALKASAGRRFERRGNIQAVLVLHNHSDPRRAAACSMQQLGIQCSLIWNRLQQILEAHSIESWYFDASAHAGGFRMGRISFGPRGKRRSTRSLLFSMASRYSLARLKLKDC
jgi:hypothetical protein